LRDGKRYDPLADAWKDMPLLGAPDARQYHYCVWTGREMLIWGGTDSGSGLF
jgi:hypothetical protein